jgi:hypothetical protein
MRRLRLAAALILAGIASAVFAGGASAISRVPTPILVIRQTQPIIATRISLTATGSPAFAGLIVSDAKQAVSLTAHVWDWNGNPLPGPAVTFTILEGPNAGASLAATPNKSGSATTQLSSKKPGTDVVQATFTDGLEVHKSNRALIEWHTGPPAAALRSPAALHVTPTCFQPTVALARVSDTLKSVTPKNKAGAPPADTGTITVTGTDFNPFTVVLITFDAGPGGRPQNFVAQTDAFGFFSRDIQVTEPGEGSHIVRADDFKEREAQATYNLPCSQGNIALDPPIGPPGFVTMVVGRNFPPGSVITLLNWSQPDLASPFPKLPITIGADGNFVIPVLILYHDLLGPRTLRAIVQDKTAGEGGALIEADAPFLVTPGRAQPDDFVQRR